MRFDAPIHLHLKPSPRLRSVIVVAHALVAVLALAAWALRPAGVLVVVAVLVSLAQLWRRARSTIEAVLLQSNDRWKVVMRGELPADAVLSSTAFVSPWLTVLRFRLRDGRRPTAMVVPGNSDPDAFRRLRVRLRVPRHAARA